MHVAVNRSSLPVYKKYRIASLLCIFETSVSNSLVLTHLFRFCIDDKGEPKIARINDFVDIENLRRVLMFY